MENIYYTAVEKQLLEHLNGRKNLKILELGCGNKIYQKNTALHQYEGLDLPSSNWIDSNNKPEILTKFSNFSPDKNYDLVFSVATVHLFDEDDLENLIKLILNLRENKGKIIIFDYLEKTISKLGSKQNNYLKILNDKFRDNLKVIKIEWCSNNKVKKKIKEIFSINLSQIIEISF